MPELSVIEGGDDPVDYRARRLAALLVLVIVVVFWGSIALLILR
jgi:hypothetical protein